METPKNQKKTKVLYLITKSNWGGAQRYVYDLVSHLDPERFECVVALGGNGPLRRKIEEHGIHTISIKSLQRDVSIWKELLSMWRIANIIRAEDPDVLHINSSKAGAMGSFLGRILFVPRVLFTAHGWAFNEDRSKLGKLVAKTIHWITVLLAHQTIAVSKATAIQLDWPGAQQKMSVVPNGRDLAVLHERSVSRQHIIEQCPALSRFASDFWSVTIGELHPVKRHDTTIAAMKILTKEHSDVRHIMIGTGEERVNLEAQIAKNGLAEHVFLVGALDEASQYLRAFDLFILASRSESLGYVLIEACFAGLPIIAADVGGIPEIITHDQTGLLFSSGNTKDLAAHWHQLINDPAKRTNLSEAALARSSDFTTQNMLDQTISMYVN